MSKGLRCSLLSHVSAANCVLMLFLSIAGSAHAIVRRHDVSDSKYLVKIRSVPGFVNLPHEGHGELINPRWVVTAAHAASDMRNHREDWFVTISGRRRAVARIVVYPDYDASTVGWKKLFKEIGSGDAADWIERYNAAMARMHDIALLELTLPVSDVKPVPYYTGSAEAGRVAELFGEGATGTDITGAPDGAPHRGDLRRAQNRITRADGPWLRYVFDCGADALPFEGVLAGGDSGGPVLINVDGKWTLAGLAHGLDGSIKDVLAMRAGTFRSGLCGQTFASTRVSFFAHWIADTIGSSSSDDRTRAVDQSHSIRQRRAGHECNSGGNALASGRDRAARRSVQPDLRGVSAFGSDCRSRRSLA